MIEKYRIIDVVQVKTDKVEKRIRISNIYVLIDLKRK